jgi:transposase
MELYCGIDLHSNNGYYGIVQKNGKRMYDKRLPNDLSLILQSLEPFRKNMKSVAVESTYNWYWLVDGLMERGYDVKLATPSAMQQYEGLKNVNDRTDAFLLAEQLRLGILPTGHIYPKEDRPVRDMLRRRMMIVQQRTAQVLSLNNLVVRQSGVGIRKSTMLKLEAEELGKLVGGGESLFMGRQNMDIIRFLSEKIKLLEERISERARSRPGYERLTGIPGVGKILALVIMLETGDVGRFSKCGNYTSYCRCANADCYSNEKKKSENNQKNGNKYLSWAFVEAAHHCIASCEKAKRFYERKKSESNGAVATKALASKLTKAAYHIMRDGVMFDEKKIFG